MVRKGSPVRVRQRALWSAPTPAPNASGGRWGYEVDLLFDHRRGQVEYAYRCSQVVRRGVLQRWLVEFRADGDETVVALEHAQLASEESRTRHGAGRSGVMDTLERRVFGGGS
jgi:hypothetical protein